MGSDADVFADGPVDQQGSCLVTCFLTVIMDSREDIYLKNRRTARQCRELFFFEICGPDV